MTVNLYLHLIISVTLNTYFIYSKKIGQCDNINIALTPRVNPNIFLKVTGSLKNSMESRIVTTTDRLFYLKQ